MAKIVEATIEDSGYLLKFVARPGKKEGKMRPELVSVQDMKRNRGDPWNDIPKPILNMGYRLAAIAFNKLHLTH